MINDAKNVRPVTDIRKQSTYSLKSFASNIEYQADDRKHTEYDPIRIPYFKLANFEWGLK